MPAWRTLVRPGLQWKRSLWGIEPEFTREPSMDIMKKIACQHLQCKGPCEIMPDDWNGSLSKLYTINCDQGRFILKVILLLVPRIRVLGEVATISFVRKTTTIPVREVIAFDTKLDNELGYGWILLRHGQGKAFSVRWHELSWLKEVLVRKIADYVAQLSRTKLSGIGSLYQYNLSSSDPANIHHAVGQYVDPYFFEDEHIHVNTHRGPYTCSSEWLAAHMEIMLYDIANLHSGDDEHHQHCRNAKDVRQDPDVHVSSLSRRRSRNHLPSPS